MGSRKIKVKKTAAENIAAISWYIESQGMLATAEKFTDDVYDYFLQLADSRKSFVPVENQQGLLWVINVFPIKRNTQ